MPGPFGKLHSFPEEKFSDVGGWVAGGVGGSGCHSAPLPPKPWPGPDCLVGAPFPGRLGRSCASRGTRQPFARAFLGPLQIDCLFALRRLEVAAAKQKGGTPTNTFAHAKEALEAQDHPLFDSPLARAFQDSHEAQRSHAKNAAFYAEADEGNRFGMLRTRAKEMLKLYEVRSGALRPLE